MRLLFTSIFNNQQFPSILADKILYNIYNLFILIIKALKLYKEKNCRVSESHLIREFVTLRK